MRGARVDCRDEQTQDTKPDPVTHRIVVTEMRGSPMEVFLFAPAGAGPHPGLVLCQHIPVGHTGIENDTVTLETAERFCANGYTVAVPFIFHWWPKSADIEVKRAGFRDDWTRLDLDAAYERPAAKPDVDRERIGIAGHCWGGRVAWLGACTNPRYKARAVFYGGRVKLVMGEGNPPAIELAGNIRCGRLRRCTNQGGRRARVSPLRRCGACVSVVQQSRALPARGERGCVGEGAGVL